MGIFRYVGGDENVAASLKIVTDLEASLSESAIEPKILKGKLLMTLMERDLASR